MTPNLPDALSRLEEQAAAVKAAPWRYNPPLVALSPDTVLALLAVARAAQAASAEIQAQKTMWPGEVDTLADALQALAQALGGNGSG